MSLLFDPLLGAIGILILFGFDLATLAGRPRLKRLILAVAWPLCLIALIRAVAHPDKLALPAWAPLAGWLISIPAALLLIYSLAIEIPFQRTYLANGTPDALVTTGTYALTRHPGVFWLAWLLLGLLLISRSRVMLIAAPAWLLLDILYVWLQDRYFFPRQFATYRQYQRQTPMLWPSRASVQRCWQTLPWRRKQLPSHPS
jgi:protein-S-isoprenylcysteine O-methyltransferase Ste14